MAKNWGPSPIHYRLKFCSKIFYQITVLKCGGVSACCDGRSFGPHYSKTESSKSCRYTTLVTELLGKQNGLNACLLTQHNITYWGLSLLAIFNHWMQNVNPPYPKVISVTCQERWKMSTSLLGCKISSTFFKSRKKVATEWAIKLFFKGCYIFRWKASSEFTVYLNEICRILCSFALASWNIVQFILLIFWTARRSRSYCTHLKLSAWSFPWIFILQVLPALLRNFNTCKWTLTSVVA